MKKKKIALKKFFLRLFLLTFFLGGCYAFLSSQLLAIGNIVVEGNTTMTNEQVYKAAGISEPVNIFNLHTDYVQARLEKDLRIKSAKVKRIFPTTLYIKIIQRKIIATIHCDYGYANIDADGLVIDSYKNLKPMKIPLITGYVFHDAYIGDHINNKELALVLTYLNDIGEKQEINISEINISNKDQIVAYTTNGVQIRLGNLQNLNKEAKQTVEFLKNIKMIKRPIEYVDFGFDSPVVRFKQ